MKQRFSKPRVFLSHSKKNSVFIERLAEDLRKCQIDPWLDVYEIRHGKSWQDEIFEYGLPACDAVLVYFTEFSIKSSVVKKEIDVGLLQQLEDGNIAFLPYVDDVKIRGVLRPDIQALQTPEWNEDNYHELLSRVVAEIWRSFLERTVELATKDERLKRAEFELELERIKNQREGVFTNAENSEFEILSNQFNKSIPLIINKIGLDDFDIEDELLHTYTVFLDLSSLIASLSNYDRFELKWLRIERRIGEMAIEFLRSSLPNDNGDNKSRFRIKTVPDLREELLTSGLVTNLTHVESWGEERTLIFKMLLSKKYFRYRYWLAVHENLPDLLCFHI